MPLRLIHGGEVPPVVRELLFERTLDETSRVERGHPMMDRRDKAERVQAPPSTGDVTERLAVVAKLLPGSRERATQILVTGAPYELGETGFRRHSVFLGEETVVFVFEGSGIEGLVRDLVNDPARSGAFNVWGPLLEGTPTLAREEFHWEAGEPQ
jgi:hypothetical protein